MDDRDSKQSIQDEKSNSGRQSSDGLSVFSKLKNILGALAAVAVVVGLHFGFPAVVIIIVSGFSLTITEILLYLILLLAIIFVPIGGTTLFLGLLDATLGGGSRNSLTQWPWIFAGPSLVGYLLFSTIPIWGGYFPQDYLAVNALQIPQISFQTGIMIVMGIVLLVTEMSLGMTNPLPIKLQRKESEDNSKNETLQLDEPRKGKSRLDRIAEVNGEFSYDWQRAPDTGFEDVGGLEGVKSEIYRRVITPLRTDNDAYDRFQVSPPTGILLYGPPGTGKSYLARAIAGELGSPFVELSQADLTSMWINESPRMVRRLFEEAELFDFSVIFIDEIDGLVATRDSSGHREDSKVISELLARLGEEGTKYLIIAATNRPDQLDSAILRAGRFDEQFEIGLPGAQEREEIFKVQLRNRKPSITESEYRLLGELSDGLTAADIASVVERAALHAAERDAPHISFDDLSISLG